MSDFAKRPVVASLSHTCDACPAQWEGKTSDGRPIYIRGRRGVLSARIGPPGGDINDAVRGKELTQILCEDADVLALDDIRGLLRDVLDFSTLEAVEPFDEWRESCTS